MSASRLLKRRFLICLFLKKILCELFINGVDYKVNTKKEQYCFNKLVKYVVVWSEKGISN